MKRLIQVVAILLIAGGLAPLAHAQLASYVDDRGNVIFINGDTPRSLAKPVVKPASKPADAAAGGASGAAATASGSASGSASGAGNAAPAAGAPSGAASAAPAAAASQAPQEYDRAVVESAQKHHVDPALVRAVISTESNWNSAAVSSKGAQGLMQIVPQTAQSLGLGNPFDPKQNIDAGVRYLSMLLARYNGDVTKALAAYNAGPAAVDRFGGVPNYRETRNYVQKVTASYFAPDSARQPRAYDAPAPIDRSVPVPIYRTVDDSGRIIFVNE